MVEEHPVHNSESLFVVEGQIEVSGPGFREVLEPGDLCHFTPGMTHGMRVLSASARYLAIFAPARSGQG